MVMKYTLEPCRIASTPKAIARCVLPLALVVAALLFLVAWTVRPALQGIFQK
jgi:hypothetical protein